MKETNWIKWSSAAEIISAIAIVASLVFVGLQIKQNTDASQVNSYQILASQIIDMGTLIAQDETLAEAYRKSNVANQELSDLESTRLTLMFIGMIRHGETAFLHYKMGFIDEGQLQAVLTPLSANWDNEIMQQVWPFFSSSTSTSLNEEYVTYLNSWLN